MNSASNPQDGLYQRGPVGRALDLTFDVSLYLAAACMVGVLAMVLAGVAGRLAGINLQGSDAYAGYCMAASSFLALAHTLKRGEHIRVMLLLERLGQRARRSMEIWCHIAGCFFCGALAVFSVRLVWQSWLFNDVSQSSDGTALWIPQIMMAVGTVILFLAMADDLWLYARNRKTGVPPGDSDLQMME